MCERKRHLVSGVDGERSGERGGGGRVCGGRVDGAAAQCGLQSSSISSGLFESEGEAGRSGVGQQWAHMECREEQ